MSLLIPFLSPFTSCQNHTKIYLPSLPPSLPPTHPPSLPPCQHDKNATKASEAEKSLKIHYYLKTLQSNTGKPANVASLHQYSCTFFLSSADTGVATLVQV